MDNAKESSPFLSRHLAAKSVYVHRSISYTNHRTPKHPCVKNNLKIKRMHRRLPLCREQNQSQRHFTISHTTSTLSPSDDNRNINSVFSTPPRKPLEILDLSMNENDTYECVKQKFHRNFIIHGSFFFVAPEDKQISTDYQFVLFCQVYRNSTVNKGKENRDMNDSSFQTDEFVGLRCRYCNGEECGGQFSPSDVKNLQSGCLNSIHNHLLTCSECPRDIQSALVSLKQRHRHQASQVKPASQSLFYMRLWDRVTNCNYHGGSRPMAELVCEILLNILLRVSHVTRK